MLRRVAILAVAGVIGAAAPAYAQQDPELEREEANRLNSDDTLDDLDATDAADGIGVVPRSSVQPVASSNGVVVAAPAPLDTRWRPALDARARVGAGVVSGDTINPGTGAITIIDADVTPSVRRKRLELSAPLDFMHRQSYATSLTEMRGRGAARVGYRWSRELRVAAELSLGATYKPSWADPFQEDMDTGDLGATDRYSHWDRRAAAEAIVRPVAGQRVHVTYEYVLAVYSHDPNFDAIYDPIHLAPWDREVHRADAEWRLREDRWRLRVGTRVEHFQYFFMFAGDAKTGVTHAGPGGEPPNPLLQLNTIKPRVSGDVDVTETVRLGARYELELVQDPFQGYLSYVGHHPQLVARWLAPSKVEVNVRAEAYLRRYGANSYAYEMDPEHPSLTFGSRREERLSYLTLAAERALSKHWSALAEAKLASRRTNYAYSIDWNYINYLMWTGAEYRY